MTLQEIYSLYANLVYNLAFKYLRNKLDTEEVSQDVFIKVHEKLSEFRNDAELKTWIYRITINTSLDKIKSKNTQKRSIYKNAKNLDDVKIGVKETPESIMLQNEKLNTLFECINQLNENQKQAFLLSKEEGLSNSEIAEIMNTSISSIESLVFRAKSKLKTLIAEKWPEYHKKKKH